MKFGIFYEHQLPRPWSGDDEHRLLKDALDQVELADRLGIDYVWEVEHHFLEEYSHSSAPEVFLAAASQRTSRIRLGHGIVQLPQGFNHSARVAERIATLDLLSDGRVDFGTGESSSEAELGGFNVDRATKRDEWDEALDAVTRMFVEEPFAGYDGRFLADAAAQRRAQADAEAAPAPLGRMQPAGDDPPRRAEGHRRALVLVHRTGRGAGNGSTTTTAPSRREECVPGGFAVNPQPRMVMPLMCHEDEETAIDRGLDGGHFFGYSLLHYYVVRAAPARADEHLGRVPEEPLAVRLRPRRSHRGPASRSAPDRCRRVSARCAGPSARPTRSATLLRGYEEAGVDQVIFVSQAGNNRHEHICESMELFAREVMPEFHDSEEARREGQARAPRPRDRVGPRATGTRPARARGLRGRRRHAGVTPDSSGGNCPDFHPRPAPAC